MFSVEAQKDKKKYVNFLLMISKAWELCNWSFNTHFFF